MALPQSPTPEGSDPAAEAARRFAELGALQPFGRDICESWHDAAGEGHVTLHARAMDELRALREDERVVLLSAPRAGHGKTHLLGRVASMIGGGSVVASLPWHTADNVAWDVTGRGILADLARVETNNDRLLRSCAGTLALLLRRLIQTGRIPSTDPAQALRVLGQDPMELFSPTGPARVIGDWFRKHFDQLSHPLAEASNLDSVEAAEPWVRAMFEYVEKPGAESLAALQSLIVLDPSTQVQRLIRLITVWRPLVLLADHMDAFYRDPATGVRVARMALALTSLPHVHLVLSMNQDLWETSFGSQLPSALEDRLNARGVSLRGLAVPDAEALVSMRLREAGLTPLETDAFLKFIDLERYFLGRPVGSVSPRALLRHAAAQWRVFLDAGFASATHEEEKISGGSAVNQPLPVFDLEARDELRRLAQSLAADAAAEQVDLSHPSGVAAHLPQVEIPSLIPPESFLAEPPASVKAPEQQPRVEPAIAPAQPAPVEEPHTNFEKLRQMLAKLRVANDTVTHPPVAPSNGSAAPAVAPVSQPQATPEELHTRFEVMRRNIAQGHPVLDREALSTLVRMAGKRFPVVRYDEVELPGLVGRSLPRWSLQGMEVVFGIEDFADVHFWKTISTFVAGRIAELGAASAQTGDPIPQLKLAVFKTDSDAAPLASLLDGDVVPAALRENLDVINLDPRSLATVGAMRRVIREAEEGSLSANPTSVLVTLSGELDFFWKRITRPKI